MIRSLTAIALLLGALSTTSLVGCGGAPSAGGTGQPALQVSRLRPGMTQAEVAAVMGAPLRTEQSWSNEAWHYCRTGEATDDFVVIVFLDGRVTEARKYRVADPGAATGAGDCLKLMRPAAESLGPRRRR